VSRPKTARSIAAQIEKSYRKSKDLLEESMHGLPKTCTAYLQRVLALAKLDQSHRDELAARGLVPVNLGTSARTVYHFKATIDEQSGPLDEERARFERELDEEFPSDNPHLRADQQPAPGPAAPVKKSKKKGKQ
jgi:hypothetical protein